MKWLSFRRSQPVHDDPSSAPAVGIPAVTGIPTGVAPTSDEEFLRRFVVERDDRAFAELVGRHGGMVLGVCRRVLGEAHDAEDAFQAVFLVLARKADTMRRGGSLPAWLHQTAFRTALRARAVRSRRREQACEELDMIAANTFGDIASEHDRSIVDEELNALPVRYRLPLFLCCVEGKSLDVAARQLGWSTGSVKGRLERGRAELRRRLLLRRVPFALGFVAVAALAPTAKAAATVVVPPSLIAATVQAGMQHAVGRSALGYVSQNALHLAQGSWNIMSLTATKIAVGFVAVAGLAVVGAGRLPSPAHAGGSGGGGITLDASFAPSGDANDDVSFQLALADEPRREGSREGAAKDGDAPRREGAARDGDAPRREGAPRDGEKPRTGPRDGEVKKDGPRDGDAPRREGAAREGASRDGAREGAPREGVREGERPNPLAGFKPQTDREEILYRMILELQREMGQLRQQIQARDGGAREGAVRRDGEGERPAVRRDGEGERPAARRDGDAPRREGEGDRPAVRRDGDAPKREGDAPRREGDAPKRDGE